MQNFNALDAEPCAVAPDARVNFGVVMQNRAR
jgi:hypothetical protein